MRPNFLTTGEAARYIGCSQTHVNRMIHDGKLKGVRTKLGFMVDPDSAEAVKGEFEARQKIRQRRLQDMPIDDGSYAALSA